jgi:hypothetical protein
MLGLPLAFSAPLVLSALALLPALWYLLRITPPRPRQIAFPPLRLILDLQTRQETPARTPWWLLLLRLALAALIIFAMAGPIWNPLPPGEGGKGPLLVVLDDGWPAAPTWNERIAAATERVTAAARDGRASAIAPVSDGAREIVVGDATRAGERLHALKPVPYLPDHLAALTAIGKFLADNKSADVVWIADGVAGGNSRAFAEGLVAAAGDRTVHVLAEEHVPLALAGADNQPGALEVRVLRADAQGQQQGELQALDIKGLPVGTAHFDFGTTGSARETKARFELPIELRNDIARVEIAGEHSAGAVSLLDERWKRRRVGIVSGATADESQPLLAPSYYLEKALKPFADVREPRPGEGDPVLALLGEQVDIMILADVGIVAGAAHDKLARFVEDGGVLLRFAGVRLAGSSDDLVPVTLRRGGRVLGGALSWETPKQLAPIDHDSPFFGLQVPKEVTVSRQVLAEPEAGLPAKTWAQLADGTPLITAERRGKGLIVLVHVTADTTWSNLPLSGLFVDMLRRIVNMSGDLKAQTTNAGAVQSDATKAASDGAETIVPTRILDGFGALGEPPLTAKPIPVNYDGPASADHPPGFYGPPDALTAVNTLSPADKLDVADFSGLKLDVEALHPAAPVDLRAWLVSLAFLLLIADAIVSIWLAGGFSGEHLRPRLPRRAALGLLAAFILGGAGVIGSGTVRAAEAPLPPVSARDLDAALHTHLAYVRTGNSEVDQASKLGLEALSEALTDRTALSPGEPSGVDPARDELVFYPFLYWPIVADAPQPSADAVTKIANYMKGGGMIVFDTRDALTSRPDGPPSPETLWLRRLLTGVDVPELEPVPPDHVVTKTFYLLDNFVGRTTTGQTWIEALPPPDPNDTRPARAGDDVSPIVITSNDLAAAWAVDHNGDPLYPLVPGGARQRELALRGGINLVMYTLTGNYKADQVHVRDLLERLAH